MSVLVPVLAYCVTPLAAVRSVSLEQPPQVWWGWENMRISLRVCPRDRLARLPPPLTNTKRGIVYRLQGLIGVAGQRSGAGSEFESGSSAHHIIFTVHPISESRPESKQHHASTS